MSHSATVARCLARDPPGGNREAVDIVLHKQNLALLADRQHPLEVGPLAFRSGSQEPPAAAQEFGCQPRMRPLVEVQMHRQLRSGGRARAHEKVHDRSELVGVDVPAAQHAVHVVKLAYDRRQPLLCVHAFVVAAAVRFLLHYGRERQC